MEERFGFAASILRLDHSKSILTVCCQTKNNREENNNLDMGR